MITKLYADNAEGRLDDARLSRMVHDLEQESSALQHTADTPLEGPLCEESPKEKYRRFLCVAQRYTHLEQLDREILLAFVDRMKLAQRCRKTEQGTGKSDQLLTGRISGFFTSSLANYNLRGNPARMVNREQVHQGRSVST